MRFFTRSLMGKLISLLLFISFIPVAGLGLVAFIQARTAIVGESHKMLDATRAGHRLQFLALFDGLVNTAETLSKTRDLQKALDLLDAYEVRGATPDGPYRTNAPEYQPIKEQVDVLLAAYSSDTKFHDIFVLCAEHGHVMYAHGQEADLGTNLGTGPYKDSGLAEAWRVAKDRNAVQITDQAYYEPSNEESFFISAPVTGSDGKLRAVVALQIGSDEVEATLSEAQTMGETGEVYLLGEDKTLRTLPGRSSGLSLGDSIDSQVAALDVSQGKGFVTAPNYRGVETLSVSSHLGLADRFDTDFEWTIVAEISEEEALGAVSRLGLWILAIALGLMPVVLFVGYFAARGISAPIREGVSVLAASTSEISATSTQLATGASQSAAAVRETSVTVEEVKQTSQLASEKAIIVSNSAQQTVAISMAGNQAVERTIERMAAIRSQMETVAESVVRLSEQSQAIGEIISAVDDMAEQSNLLAVNASIEAAKAGEHGRGFAVVAQEVKSLAEQSKNATSQVRGILNDIQKATGAAVMATEQGTKAVDAGTSQSQEAGNAIRRLSDSISEAMQAVTQIAASNQQQFAGVEQITGAMKGIQDAAEQSVEGARQLENAVIELNQLGHRLEKLV